MRSTFLHSGLALILVGGYAYGAASKDQLREHLPSGSKAAAVLDRKSIDVAASGQVQADFHTAMKLFLREDMMELVQAQYAAMLPAGESPRFSLVQTSPGVYSYTNRDQETSEIVECFKIVDESGEFQLLYLTHGERFFGRFEALIHIQAKPAATPGATDFTVQIHACPQNRVSRAIITRLPVVPWYFRRRTHEMVKVGSAISTELCRQAEEENLNAVKRSMPAGKSG